MKNLKRKFTSLLLVLILILSTTLLGSCYFVRSGKPKQIQGTYSLTLYSGNGNYITERGMELLMVLDGSGKGYYAYKDNDTAPFVAELKYTMDADSEKQGKYSYVNLDFGNGKDPHRMAVNADWKSTKFNSQQAVWKGGLFSGDLAIDYYVNVNFERVSKSTDLSYIQKSFNTAKIHPFGTRVLDGSYYLFSGELPLSADDYSAEKIPSPFICFFVDLDLVKDKATLWYALKSDSVLHKETYNIAISNNENIVMTIDGAEMIVKPESNSFYIPYPTTIQNEGEEAREVTAYISLYFDGDATPEEIDQKVEERIATYNAANQPPLETE